MLALRLSIVVPILFAAGCVSHGRVRSLTIAGNNSAVVGDFDGAAVMRSEQTHLVSVLPVSRTFSNGTYALPSFHVIVANAGRENITLKPGDISAFAGEGRVALLDPAALQ